MERKKILIIEDDPKTQYAMHAILEEAGFQAFSCTTTEELQSLDHQPFDAAIIDVRLPGAPGTEAAVLLQQRQASIRIVFVTAYNGIDEIQARFPGCPVLVKPIELETIFQLLGPKIRKS